MAGESGQPLGTARIDVHVNDAAIPAEMKAAEQKVIQGAKEAEAKAKIKAEEASIGLAEHRRDAPIPGLVEDRERAATAAAIKQEYKDEASALEQNVVAHERLAVAATNSRNALQDARSTMRATTGAIFSIISGITLLVAAIGSVPVKLKELIEWLLKSRAAFSELGDEITNKVVGSSSEFRGSLDKEAQGLAAIAKAAEEAKLQIGAVASERHIFTGRTLSEEQEKELKGRVDEQADLERLALRQSIERRRASDIQAAQDARVRGGALVNLKVEHEREMSRLEETATDQSRKRAKEDALRNAVESKLGFERLEEERNQASEKANRALGFVKDPSKRAEIQNELNQINEGIDIRKRQMQREADEQVREANARNAEEELAGVERISQERKDALDKLHAERFGLNTDAERAITEALERAMNKAFDNSIKRFNLQLRQQLDQITGAARDALGGEELVSSLNNVGDLMRIISNNRRELPFE